jgi:hypothetical protein
MGEPVRWISVMQVAFPYIVLPNSKEALRAVLEGKSSRLIEVYG